ncbi:prolyl oligopeptidase family serine peptidase [Ornithinimicrobium pekingense]|uniref:Peptidase n=1 Tax=Ornithinimicrobium pekingense TaxID=384677 RepID=A0ABQ2FE79_9MICO|nr:prolyl oligopeptidase family serine peptidase [Ornithinimicrobium pekingense]GGK76888.1 peptidase [Ornithinimicrobium pekingense]
MQTLPYGSWPSPVDARRTLSGVTRRDAPRADGADLYWLEARPEDAGSTTLVRRRDGVVEDVSPAGHDVRTRYLEYGGGDYGVRDGTVLWVEGATQRVWRAAPGEEARPLTPGTNGAVRWSCFRVDPRRRVVFCLREDLRDETLEPVVSLVRLDLDGDNADLGSVLVAGKERPVAARADGAGDDLPGPDFVADPVLSPDGTRLAWLTWDHPAMPWHRTTLWLGVLDAAGDLVDERAVGTGEQSLEQPLWLDDETLLVLGDASGWSNLHRLDVSRADAGLEAVTDEPFELGHPRWVPDTRSYDLLAGGRVVSGRSRDGFRDLVVVDLATGEVEEVETSTTYVRDVAVLSATEVAVDAARADATADVLLVHLPTGQVRPSVGTGAPTVPDGFAALPQPVSWHTPDGATAHGFLYLPTHPDVQAPEGDLPPLIVTLHGGPTACATPGLSAGRTFWTSRGFAVLDVNYGGSTGYGRAYRERLDGRWGEVDVQDAASGARHLAESGAVDGSRLLITGGSAGGFTTLAAATFTDTFAAGASHFGISDLATLAQDTHKLESRYIDGLVAPWPEGEATFTARSPIHHVDRLATPLILLQGLEDKVVPPSQAQAMAEVLRRKGLPVALVLFEGEGHGFRWLDNQVGALEAELSFYAQVLGLRLADDIPEVSVENL